MCRYVGMVFQDPEAQFVTDQVEDEIAFALENSAFSRTEMQSRVRFVLEELDLVTLRERKLDSLSGGERQRVAIASALAFQPTVLLLDEPTSQLDPQAAEGLLQILVALKKRLQLTIVLVEHRLERILPFADKLIYLDASLSGAISGPPSQVQHQIPLNPPVVALAKALGWEPVPLTVANARKFLNQPEERLRWQDIEPAIPDSQFAPVRDIPTTPAVHVTDISAGYDTADVLHRVSLDLFPGETLVVMGPNGAGKSTLLRCLVGLTRIRRGSIEIAGQSIAGLDVAEICLHVGYLPQDPNALLFADTVQDELLLTLRNHQLSSQDYAPMSVLESLGLASLAEAYPRDLSSGERQRTAMGAVMVTRPGVLLLDEPTRGLDYIAKAGLVELLNIMKSEGMAIILVTHDVELAACVASRVAWMEAGEITKIGSPIDILTQTSQFCPQIAKLFPGTGWLTVKDVLAAKK